MTDPDHLGEHPVAGGRQQRIVKVAIDVAVDREVAGFERSAFEQLVAGGKTALDDLSFLRAKPALRDKANRYALQRGADIVGIDDRGKRKFAHREAAIGA